jgi:rhamnosyltransferase
LSRDDRHPAEALTDRVRRVALFAHFDADARVRPFVLHLLKELRTVADEIVFVSTAALPPEELDKVRPFCARATLKENVGFDFGMWRDAMESIDLHAWDELIITNSSVFGPLRPLAPIFETMKDAGDVWGMTDNVEVAWHLQSYFLVFRKKVITSKIFREFWQGILPYKDKVQVIRSYEIGLSRLLLDHGFDLRAFVPRSELPASRVPPLGVLPDFKSWWYMLTEKANLTCSNPVALLRAGMPFVKIQLLRDNPLSVPLGPVLALMKESGWDMSMMEFDR